jgi:hypothetical protein
MPKKQIRTNDNFLQRDFEGTNNKRQSANNKISGNNNVVSFENNMVAGDRNSAAGKTIILGDNNLVGNPSRVAVIGRDNILTSTEGMIIGASNSLSAPLKNFYLFGVDGLSMTQSVNNVWIFGNPPLGTYSIGTQSFQNTLIAPTQSGIYAYQNVFLGPGVNIFNNNGLPISSQNLNQVLTVGNTTGGQDIEVSTGDVLRGDGVANAAFINFDDSGDFTLSTNGQMNIGITPSPPTNITVIASVNIDISTTGGILSITTPSEDNFIFNDYAFKTIDIGSWDMSSNIILPFGTSIKYLTHSLSATEWVTIINPSFTFRNDIGDERYTSANGFNPPYIFNWDSTQFTLDAADFTSSPNFTGTTFSRGTLRFQYIPD